MTGAIDRLSSWISWGLIVLSCLFFLLMMLHVSADLILRYTLNRPIVATLEVVSFYYMVFGVFLSFAYAETRREHIRVDLFAQMMPRVIQLGLYLFGCLLSLVFFAVLAYQGYLDALRATQRAETYMGNFLFYIWPSRWALPVGFAALCLAVFAKMLKAIRKREAL